ncbi:hypothetical protein F5883DRAFT_468673, partial [Diaporthe sp. PMI_573]
MAQPQQLLPRHFYLPSGGPAWGKLKVLYDRTPWYEKEDVNQHAWAAILRTYFLDYDPAQLQPGQVPPNQSTFYDVIVQPYRGIPLDDNWKTRPDVVTVRIHQAIQLQGGQVTEVNRDLIWVECKAPSKDQPSEWKKVMNEAVKRLDMAHPTRPLFLILNVGLKWLIFYWNPTNPAVAGQHLRIINAAGTEAWDVDPRIHAPPGINGGHIDQNNVIHATRAKSLD